MSAFAVDIDRDAEAVRAMASALDPYLYQDELYGALPGALPRLTLGGLLMRLHRQRALREQLTPEQSAALGEAEAKHVQARADWALHYDQKIRRELGARQDALKWFLDECDDHPQRCGEGYPTEAEKRTMIHHLLAEGDARNLDLGPERQRQLALDGRLREHFRAGDFIWTASVQAAYPRATFWWLYGRPGRGT